jgi:hypothetical protein
VADLMASRAADDPDLEQRAAQLRESIGLEERAAT